SEIEVSQFITLVDGQLPLRPTTHEVIQKQRWRLPHEAAPKHRLSQKDLKSATIQVAPVMRKVKPNSDQFRCTPGRAIRRGIQTTTPKSASMRVIRRIASRAWRLMRMAIAASANAIVVSIAQNIWLGGIHFGTKSAVTRR